MARSGAAFCFVHAVILIAIDARSQIVTTVKQDGTQNIETVINLYY